MPSKRQPISRRAAGPISAEAWDWLEQMFGADAAAEDYYERFPPYHEVTLGIGGVKPWWPPLALVNACGPTPPDAWSGSKLRRDSWAAAHTLLAALFKESLLAR